MTDRPAFVYVMRRADGIRKVGSAVSLEKRRKCHVAMYSQPVEFEISWSMSEVAARIVEMFVHRELRPYRFKELQFMELYDLPLRRIVSAVRAAKMEVRPMLPYGDLNRGWATDADVLAVKHLGTARAAKRIGMTPGGYIKRLHAAEKRAQEALVKPQLKEQEASKEDEI